MSSSTPNERALRAFPRQPRLSDRVGKEIIETIVAQRLQPGDALPPERELGEQFGVSRTVVREAVRALEARGLLDVRVGSRIKVAAVDPSTVRDAIWQFARTARLDETSIATLSESLEAIAAHAAARHATTGDLTAIEQALDRDDEVFRRAVISASHNELLIALAEAICELTEPSLSGRLQDHRSVADAIARGDSDGAEQAMRNRVRQPG